MFWSMLQIIYVRFVIMKIIIFTFSMILLSLVSLSGCQSVSPTEARDVDSDVCIGDPMVVDDPDKPVDLEDMANQAECP